MKFSSIKKQQQKHQHYEQQLYDTQHPNWPPKITTSEATLNHPFWAQRDHWIEQVQQHTSRSLGRVRDQMPPQIPPTSHIHEGPEPRHYQSANLDPHKFRVTLKRQRFCKIEAKGWSGWTLEVALEEASEESEILGLDGTTTVSPSSSAVGGWDLRFRRTKKPARVADKNTRMNLRGHILLSEEGRRMRLRIGRVCGAHSWTQETKSINNHNFPLR